MQWTHRDSRLAGCRRSCDEKWRCVESLTQWNQIPLGCRGETLGILGPVSKTQQWFWVKTTQSKRLSEATLKGRSLNSHWDMLIMSAFIKSENSATPEQNNHICPFMEPSTAFLLSGKDGIGLLVVSTSLEYAYADSLEQKAHVFTQHRAYSSAQETVFQYLTIWPSTIDPVLLKWELEGPKWWLSTGQDLTSFWNWSFLLYFHRTMCSDFHSGSWVKHDIGKKLPDLERQCGLEREAGIWDAMPVPVPSAFALALWN